MRDFTRREILAAFLGAPAAIAACRRTPAPQMPDGSIVGASDRFGHRLRDGFRIEPPADAWRDVGVVIVGAGVAGLSAAWRLERAGYHDFVVCELEPAAGGTARSGESRICRFPWGAHYIPVPTRENPALITLLSEMGILEGTDAAGEPVAREELRCRYPQERIFFRGQWYEGLYLYAGASAEDLRQLRAFEADVGRWVAWRDARGRRAFTIPIARGSDDAEVTALDRISMADYLRARGLTSPRLRWMVEYACRDDYGSLLETTSAWAGLFYFASRVPEPKAESEPLITWPEGNGRLVDHLARSAKGRLWTGLAVSDIDPVEGGVRVKAIARDERTALGFRAKRVIFASPQFLAPLLIRPYRDSPPAHVRHFEYGAWMVANLELRDRPVERAGGFPLSWDNVLYESPSLGYVVATHQLGIDRGPTVLTYYYALCDDDANRARERLLSTGWRGWADVALSDLSIAHPDIRDLTERLDVMRWGHAMIRPRRGFLWSGARQKAAEPYRGIHFAHSDLSGIALFEEAFFHGIRAAEEVLGAFGIQGERMV
jgi:glycine/D-amino acid oxidase-like deaminating enzyme